MKTNHAIAIFIAIAGLWFFWQQSRNPRHAMNETTLSLEGYPTRTSVDTHRKSADEQRKISQPVPPPTSTFKSRTPNEAGQVENQTQMAALATESEQNLQRDQETEEFE